MYYYKSEMNNFVSHFNFFQIAISFQLCVFMSVVFVAIVMLIIGLGPCVTCDRRYCCSDHSVSDSVSRTGEKATQIFHSIELSVTL